MSLDFYVIGRSQLYATACSKRSFPRLNRMFYQGDSNNNPESAKTSTSIKMEAEVDLKPSVDKDANLESEYAFITLDGKKWPVPKILLRDDYLRTAEDAPPPEQYGDDQSMKVEVSSEENCDGEIDREELIQVGAAFLFFFLSHQ